MSDKSLGDYILDRTESLQEQLILNYFIERNDVLVNRLLDVEQYLLEGSRGVGKTMLMKAAMLKSRSHFEQNSVLSVWVSFEESIRLERIKVTNDKVDPFLQWTMGKTLLEFLKEIKVVVPKGIQGLSSRLAGVFNIESFDLDGSLEILEKYVNILEKGDLKTSDEIESNSPSNEVMKILDNPSAFKSFITKMCDDCNISRVVFLFDEAAHMFSHSQQENFFNFFKVLRDPRIACKAAVYPGVTNYGKFFERGQDAKELRLSWSPRNEDDLKYIKKILKHRIQDFNSEYWNRLTNDNRVIETICVCSNGNPRFAFHIIDVLDEQGNFEKNISLPVVIKAIRRVFEAKWKEFSTLKNRLLKYSSYIEAAESFVRGFAAPHLLEWNKKRRDDSRALTTGVYVETSLFTSMSKLFEVLAYSSIADIDYSKKSIGHKKYGYFLSFNPSLLLSDLILKDSTEVLKSSIAIENSPSYTLKNEYFTTLIDDIQVETQYSCSSCTFQTNNDEFSFCPKCGSDIIKDEPVALYKILRSHDISELKLSDFLISRCKTKFNTIGDIYDASIEDLKTIYNIGDVRASHILNTSIEYMAG